MQLYPGLCLNRTASVAVNPYRIVKATTTDGVVAQSSAASDKHVAVSGHVGAALDERVDVYLSGVVPVEYGGNVADGDLLTSDASGRAIVATAGSRVIGVAQEKGDLGTIGSLLIAPSIFPVDT